MTLLDSIYLKAEALRIPLNVHFELTQRCNENCIHCFIKGARDKLSLSRDEQELTLSQIEKLLDDLAQQGALNLTFTGGEAMLREDFFEVAWLAKEQNFAITIFSNGQLIDEKKADRLAEIMPVCVYFSIYGSDFLTHDKITQVPGSFEKLLNAIGLLKEKGIKIGLKTMVMNNNLSQLQEIFQFGRDVGTVHHQFDAEIIGKIDGSVQPKNCQIDEPSLYTYYKGDVPAPPRHIEELPQDEAAKKPMCGAGLFGVAISSFGDIYPCPELRIPLGNVKYESFKKIWDKDDGFLKEFLSVKKYKDLPYCRDCSLLNFCRHCPGRAFFETSDWRLCYESAFKRALLVKKINEELTWREVK